MSSAAAPLTLCLPRWNTTYSRQGGVTTISLFLARAWRRLGCKIVWVGSAPPDEFRDDIHYYAADPSTEGLVQGMWRALGEHTVDVVVTFEPFIEGPAAAVIRSHTGLYHAHFGMHMASEDASALAAETHTYASADLDIFQCRWFQDNYVSARFGADFIGRKRSLVVPFGVDTDAYTPEPLLEKQKEPLVVFTGRLNRENCLPPEFDKGAIYLIRAIPAIVRECGTVRFEILGSGPQLPQLQSELEGYGTRISALVAFAGDVTERDTLLRRLQAASMFTLPSVCDVFPVAIIEALAAGLPIVSTAVGGIPECVDESCGVLVEPKRPDLLARAICMLLSNPSMRKDMSQNARSKAVREYDWRVAATATLSAFTEMAANS